MSTQVFYRDNFHYDRQLDTEEMIASIIFNHFRESDEGSFTEEDCNKVAKIILLKVLHLFRPDLTEEVEVIDK